MSLVGTRPPTVDEWDKYELHHRARLATKPGLTGMWQVSGRSNITDFEEVVKLDKQYISEYEDGQFTTESIENFMLFVPFSILLLWAFQKELLDESENIRFGKTVWETTKVVAVFSFMIEFTQLLFHLGTFQISDLTYNTLGGAVGGVIYYLGYSRKRKK
jgi:glycopeptide antibiotics resistance protein